MSKLHLTLAEFWLTQAKTWLTQAKFCPNSAKKSPNSNFRRVVVSARHKSAEKKPLNLLHTYTLNQIIPKNILYLVSHSSSLLNRNSVVRISAVRGPSDKIEVSAGRSWPQDEHLMCTFWIPEPAGPEIRKNWKNVLPFTSSIQKRKTLKKLFNWTFLRTSKPK